METTNSVILSSKTTEQMNRIRKEMSTLQYDIPNIKNMDLKLSKEKRLKELTQELNVP